MPRLKPRSFGPRADARSNWIKCYGMYTAEKLLDLLCASSNYTLDHILILYPSPFILHPTSLSHWWRYSFVFKFQTDCISSGLKTVVISSIHVCTKTLRNRTLPQVEQNGPIATANTEQPAPTDPSAPTSDEAAKSPHPRESGPPGDARRKAQIRYKMLHIA